MSGPSWYQISAVNGTSVQSLYGVSYVYAASGLFKTAVTVAPPPTPTPTTHADTRRRPRRPARRPTPIPTPTPGKTIEGIDISHWQGTINWPSVAAAGKKFAFMKATEDTDFSDPTYTSNRAGARAAGLSVGAYHFAQPSTAAGNGAAQADWFVNGATPARGDLLPVLDLERSNGLTPAQLTTWVQDFLGRVYTRLGVRGIIYCSPSFWKTYMGDTGWFASNGYTILWVAHWTTGLVADRARGQLGRQELDVLAVHLGWHGRRDLRPSRHGSLQRHGPHEGADPLADPVGPARAATPPTRRTRPRRA